ncbi:MAG: nitroreductase family protein, partial [Eubacterium sp.]|nr:nitroreductase family protein [Eubacterium sp.]
MSFIDLAKNRFSCRKFDSKPVEQKKIDVILESARVAPTAVNKQPQRILVVDDRKIIESLKGCTKYTFDAPLCFIICVNKNLAYNRGYDGKNSADIDGS